MAKHSAKEDKLPASVLKAIEDDSQKLVEIAMWICRCTVAVNHFSIHSGDLAPKSSYIRDSEGLAASRRKERSGGLKRKRDEAVGLTRQPGDLSLCPRWQLLRQRILDKARRA